MNIENELKESWKEDIKIYKYKKKFDNVFCNPISNIFQYKSKEFERDKLRDAEKFCIKHKGVIAKLVNDKGAVEGYLVQWQEKKEEKKHREFNYKRLRKELYEK